MVLDSGEGITHAVPVYEGYAIPHATVRADFGGRDITNHLQLLLRKSGHLFHTTAEKEVVREIKEVKCYVTYDPDKEEQLEMEQGKAFAMHTLPDGTNISIGYVRVYKTKKWCTTACVCGSWMRCCWLQWWPTWLHLTALQTHSLIG